MVKKWIVISVIIVGLILGCILEYNYVNNSFDSLQKQLEDYNLILDKDKENINSEENINYIEQVHLDWQDNVSGLKALIWHTGIKDIEIGLAKIKVYTIENDYTEALAELRSLIDYVKHYKEDFTISLENLL